MSSLLVANADACVFSACDVVTIVVLLLAATDVGGDVIVDDEARDFSKLPAMAHCRSTTDFNH